MNQKPSLKKELASILIGIFLFLVILELLLRFAGMAYYWFYKPHSEFPLEFPENSYRIMCVGESTTWGIGTPDPSNDGYPKQLEQKLRAHFPSKEFACFFDQSIGQNSSEILLKLPVYIEKYKPDLVILMAGINNWWNLRHSNALLFCNKSSISTFFMRSAILLDHLRVWKLFKLIGLRLKILRERWDYFHPNNVSDASHAKALREKYPQIIDSLKMVLDHDIDQMIAECKRSGVHVILCTYPAGIYYPNIFDDRWDTVFEDIANENNIPFVDNFKTFRALPNRRAFMYDMACHPNKQGYAIVADNIFQAIIDNDLIDSN